jgi:predicted acyl esterase
MSFERSSPQYEVRVVRNVRILLSDGTHLAADLFFPDAPGRFPAVFDY